MTGLGLLTGLCLLGTYFVFHLAYFTRTKIYVGNEPNTEQDILIKDLVSSLPNSKSLINTPSSTKQRVEVDQEKRLEIAPALSTSSFNLS